MLLIKRFAIYAVPIVVSTGVAMAHSGLRGPLENTTQPKELQLAQFKLILGTSDKRIRRTMRDNGYTEVEIKHRGLTKALADGCKRGGRFRVEITPRGRIRAENKIGDCRPPISIGDARDRIRDRGYRRIEIEERGDVPFVATACRRGDRFAINVNRYGDVNIGKKLGSCRRRLSQDEMRVSLRKRGYDRIDFLVDRSGRRTLAEACRKGGRFELAMNRRGKIVDEKRIGRCAKPIAPRDLVSHIEGQGYDRVDVTDRQLPRYQADACRGTTRFELVIGRYGKIRRETRVGRCPPPIDERGLRRLMTRNGFSKIQLVATNTNEYSTIACQKDDRMSVRFSRYGEVIDQKRLGSCVSPRIDQILQKLDANGVRKMTIHFEGCRGRNRIRFTYNEYGEQLDRERIGRCLVSR
ncbi:MAG: hypothetical protein AAF346_08210 [Pseudomonadota bacterium]